MGVLSHVGSLGLQAQTALWDHHRSIGSSRALRSTAQEGEAGVFIHVGVFSRVGALGFQAQTTLWVNIRSRVNKRGQEDEGVKIIVKLLYSLSRYH